MKRILVPTDFSECAERAAHVGADLAKKTGAKLYLMHIINMPTYESNTSIESWHNVSEGIFIMKLVKKKFGELMSKEFLQGIEVEDCVAFNTVYEAISDKAKELEIDLLVMGSHGMSGGTNEYLVGSNTERVVRSSEIPVLTIKKAHEKFTIRDIVFASNFYEESYTVFEQIARFAALFDAHIHLLKVVTQSHFETTRYSLKLMDDFVKAVNFEGKHSLNVYNDDKIENGIHHFAEEIDADMIAMETHGRTGIKHMLWGSITESVANHATMPVLSVKIPKEENTKILFPD